MAVMVVVATVSEKVVKRFTRLCSDMFKVLCAHVCATEGQGSF